MKIYNYNSQRGLALLMVLVFLQIFALLGLSLLQKNRLHLKLIGFLWQKQEIRIQAETVLTQIELELRLHNPRCLIPHFPAAKLPQQSTAWWKASSCAGNFKSFQYYYVIEKLGQDDCTFIQGNGPTSDIKVAYFYRISLLMMSRKAQTHTLQPRVILQSLFLKKGKPIQICKLNSQHKQEGRQEIQVII